MGSSLRQCQQLHLQLASTSIQCIAMHCRWEWWLQLSPETASTCWLSSYSCSGRPYDEIEPCQNKLLEKNIWTICTFFHVIWLLSLFFGENGTGVLLHLVGQQKKARSRRLDQQTHFNSLFPSCRLSEYRYQQDQSLSESIEGNCHMPPECHQHLVGHQCEHLVSSMEQAAARARSSRQPAEDTHISNSVLRQQMWAAEIGSSILRSKIWTRSDNNEQRT